MEFGDLKLADGEIVRILLTEQGASVVVVDHREECYFVAFGDVIGLESWGLPGAALSGVSETASDPSIAFACDMADEPTEHYRCFSFIGAGSGKPVLKIVSADVIVTETTR